MEPFHATHWSCEPSSRSSGGIRFRSVPSFRLADLNIVGTPNLPPRGLKPVYTDEPNPLQHITSTAGLLVPFKVALRHFQAKARREIQSPR